MIRKYAVLLKNEDPMIISVKDDVNRPNNPDCDAVLQEWIHENYGYREYDYFELDSAETLEI